MIIGLDDTDSREKGMCTTYLAVLIAEKTSRYGHVEDIILQRLNPNAPHRTRGNACLAIHIETDDPGRIQGCVERHVEKHAILDDPLTNPGAAFLFRDEPSEDLIGFSMDAVRKIVDLEDAQQAVNGLDTELTGWGNKRGVIGATAALGARATQTDQSYELITYRESSKTGDQRIVSYDSLLDINDRFYPEVWDTVDTVNNEAVAVPNTPCPVLYGLRGESTDDLWRAASMVKSEDVQRACLFRTNQGTDMHLLETNDPDELRENQSYRYSGVVTEPPATKEGGHVFLELDESVRCAAFEPTKQFRDKVRALKSGDKVTVCGGIKKDTLNLEKIHIDELVTTEKVNPRCDGCGNSMKSAGRGQGYRCKDCGTHSDEKQTKKIERDLDRQWYEVPPSARRHLSKPLCRQ